MNLSLFIARRLHGVGEQNKKVSRSAITIATAGVALGVAVMLIAVSVVLGFKETVRDKISGIGGHIQVLNYESLYSSEYRPIAATDALLRELRAVPEVSDVQRYCLKSGMLKTEESFQGVVFRGVDQNYELSFLLENLDEGSLDGVFSDSTPSGKLVLSTALAKQLGLQVGQKVYAYFFDGNLRARRFTVSALFTTNMADYDQKVVFCDYATMHALLGFEPDQCSGIDVVIDDYAHLTQAAVGVSGVVSRKQDAYGAYYTAPTVRDLHQGVFAWLDLLDTNVVVILVLMMLVAGFSMISGLLIIILERTQFIGVMKALGATNSMLRHTFIYYASFIVIQGLLIGNLLGLGVCYLQKWTGIIRLDSATYYVSQAPVLVSWLHVCVINLCTFLIAVLVLVVPSYIVSHIHPARSIRFE